MKKNFIYILTCILTLGIWGCTDKEETPATKELKIFSMTPTEGVAGDEVTITGEGFSIVPSENIVTLNGERLTAVETTVTILKMTVPYNQEGTYPIIITTNGQTVEGPSFTYTESSYDVKLELDPLETTSGYPGDEITITGKGFSGTAAENEVYFNETAATIKASSATSLTVVVPELEPGEYTLTVKAGVQEDRSLKFNCLAIPVTSIGSISPTSGHEGTEIIITGENFSPVPSENTVTINGKQATVTAATEMELTVTAPANEIGSYKVMVTVNGKTVEGPEFEYVKPELVYTVSNDIYVGEKLVGLTGPVILPDGRLAVAQRGDAHSIIAFDLQNKTKSVLCNKYADGHPWNIGLNPVDKNLYIAYKGKGEIGRVDPSKGDGQNTEILVSGLSNVMDVKFDAQGNMYALCRDEKTVYRFPAGNFNNASKQTFAKMGEQSEGLYSMDFDGDGNLIVGAQRDGFYMVAPDGKVTRIAGSGDGSTDGEAGDPMTAKLVQPSGTVVDRTRGDIYFTDPYNQKIRRIRPGKSGYADATVSTIAGTGTSGNTDGDGSTAQLKMPYGLTISADGSAIYFSDMDNFIMRKITITEKE